MFEIEIDYIHKTLNGNFTFNLSETVSIKDLNIAHFIKPYRDPDHLYTGSR